MCDRLCWAAHVIHGNKPGGSGVVCKIEGMFIPKQDNSYKHWCTGNYSQCPTWRSHNADRWRGREHDVETRRKQAIEEQYGPADEVADSFMEGTATLEDVMNSEN